jgi:general L-amino acid transport system substrate-binding protein
MVAASPVIAASRVDGIRARGYLTCGISTQVTGFARLDPEGRADGFEPDLCRAIAAAILGPAGSVRFVEAKQLGTFVAAGEPDVVARRLTVTLRRERMPGVVFGPVVFYDGAALLVRATAGIDGAHALSGHPVCVTAQSEAEGGLTRLFLAGGWTLRLVPAASDVAAREEFLRGGCDALAADLSELAAIRANDRGSVDLALLPGLFTKEPLALLLHGDDPQFVSIVRWTIFALIAAEENGITRANLVAAGASADPDVRRLLGVDRGNGAALGLGERWAANAIATVGNYGEIFERHLGSGSPLKLARGPNALWREGGLMYALPLR